MGMDRDEATFPLPEWAVTFPATYCYFPALRLGCYFCNDVVGPLNSTQVWIYV